MSPSQYELSPRAGGNNSSVLPLTPDNNLLQTVSPYLGRNVGGQEHCEPKLPPGETPGTSSGETPLMRNVSHLEDELPDGTFNRLPVAHAHEDPVAQEDECQYSSAITTKLQLMAACQIRNIIVKPTLYKLFNSCPNEQETQLIAKLGIYFNNVRKSFKNTRTITMMLLIGEGTLSTKKNINTFLSTTDHDVKSIARSPFLNDISSICHGKGFPNAGDVDALLKLPSLRKDDKPDRQLLRFIASIYHGKGFPNAGEVDTLLKLPSLQTNGQLDRRLLSSISSICHGKGFPNAVDVDTLLKLPILQKNGRLDRQLLHSISSICHGKGFPNAGDVDTLLKLPILQTNGQLDRQLLHSISSICHGKGFPNAGNVDTLLKLPILQTDGQLDRQLLSSVSLSLHGKGFPDENWVREFTELIISERNSRLPAILDDILSSEEMDFGFDVNYWESILDGARRAYAN